MLLSDNGPSFRSLWFKEFCARLDIVQIRVNPYQHQVKGVAKRMIQTVKYFMRNARLPEGLSLALLNYRCTPLDAKTPASCVLLNNHPFRTILSSISLVYSINETHEILADRKAFMTGQFNSKLPVKANGFLPSVGDPILYQMNTDCQYNIMERYYCYPGIR